MKKIFALLAVVLAVVSCQKEINGLPVDSNNEAAVSLSVALPDDATRAAGADSAKGGVTNYDANLYDIRFILEVYDENGVLAKERMVKSGDATKTSFQLRLVPGRAYNFVVWADFVTEGTQADLYYNTNVNNGGLRNVQVIDDKWDAIIEARDAYTDVFTVHNFSSTSTINMTLTRPFAKLRVVTNDIKEMISVRPAEVKVNYIKTKFYDTFDAFAEEAKNLVDAPANLTATLLDAQNNPVDVYSEGYDALETSQTLFADYFFGAEDDRVMFTFDVKDNGGRDLPQVTFNTNIPVNRNYLTTVYGPILTDANNITVTIKEAFENQDNPNDPPYYVEHKEAGSAEQLVEIFEDIADATGETHIVLTGDIDLSELFTRAASSTSVTVPAGKAVVLDLKDYNITSIDNETASFGLFNINPGAKLTIEGNEGSIKLTATNNRGWNAYSSVISNQRGELVVNGGTIEHLGGTDMAYAIDNLTNTGAEKAKTTINGGVVKSTYRAVRQFLNSTSALNELIVNGGTIDGRNNRSIWMQNANAYVNPGKLVVAETASLYGNVMVSGSNAPELAIELSVAENALKDNAIVVPSNIPAGYAIYVKDGKWVVEDGVEENGDYVTILNAGGLKWLADLVNAGENYFAGKTIKLVADIDLNNEEWTPIGSAYADHGFMGNFDGNGKTIKNLAIKNITPDSDGSAYAGLFGVTEGVDANNENYIKNLTIENVTIATTGDIVAAAVAYPYYTKLENITVNGDVKIKGGNYTAGVLAYTRRCVNAKNIAINADAGSVIEGNMTVGGVISDIQTNGGLVANYSNFAASGLTIKGVRNIGGISGIIGGQTLNGAKVENVTIVSNDVRKGILVGSLGNQSAINNVDVNNVTGAHNYVGANFKDGSISSVTIDGVVYEYLANGQIKVNGSIIVADGVILNEAEEYIISNTAGMFWFANEVNVNKNAFSGKTVKLTADINLENEAWTPVGQTGATTFNGVFDGQNYTISNLNVNSATQTGAHYSSGLFGWVESHTAGHGHIKNVKIAGATIVGHHNCGALVGYITQQTALVENCHVTGANVSCTYANGDADGDKAGALIGNATVATPVKDCTAANSTVSAGRDAGQVIGAGKEANVTGCSATNVAVSANGTGTGANVRNEVIGRLL